MKNNNTKRSQKKLEKDAAKLVSHFETARTTTLIWLKRYTEFLLKQLERIIAERQAKGDKQDEK